MGIFIEQIATLYDSVICVWFVMKFCGGNIKESKLFFPTIALSFVIINIFSNFNNLIVNTVMLSVLLFIILFTYSLTIKSSKLINRILSSLLYNMVTIIINSLMIFVLSKILNTDVESLVSVTNINRYLLILICKIVMTAVLLILIRIFTIKSQFSFYDLLLYLLFPCITVVTLYTFIQLGIDFDTSRYSALIISVILALAILNVLAVLWFRRSVDNVSAQLELDMLKKRNELEEKRYRELGRMYEQLRITRHDIRDHLVSINCLLEEHRYDDVEKYISEKQAELEKTEHICHTNNRVIDYIIDSYMTDNRDIFFIVSGEYAECDYIDPMDISSLLGNMLSNAVRGAEGSHHKQIEISFAVNGYYFNIICKNTVPKSVLKTNPKLISTKKDSNSHGYGIKSMQCIVDKYDGMMQFYEEGRKFCVHASLPMVDLSTL